MILSLLESMANCVYMLMNSELGDWLWQLINSYPNFMLSKPFTGTHLVKSVSYFQGGVYNLCAVFNV